jgi:hypothetical protein
MPGRDDGTVGDLSATRRPGPTPTLLVGANVPPTLTVVELPSDAPPPLIMPTPGASVPPPVEPPIATPRLTPAATPEPTRSPRPEPPPQPTPEPTPAPPPPADDPSVRIPDRSFTGDYNGQGSGRYHGRSASWVYGQGTPYDTMTAQFQLGFDGQVGRRASLQIVGLDGENARKNRISIVLNGVTIYEGPNTLPNDACCGPSGPGNWGSVVFEFPGELLRRSNSLVISNLEPGDCTSCPSFVMVDYAVVEYRVRP